MLSTTARNQILPGRRYQLVVQPTGEWRAKRPPIRPMAYSTFAALGFA